ncbi:MAG TPA: sulfite exporter TauE/SafE family protein [Woeseiaceae bacterium]|nr:sulfite exporter TauE/SafE family protein [Woeseiaceae bacterium]
MNPELLLPAAFLAGFFGSTHCLGMCGAIVVLFEERSQTTFAGGWRRLLYNSGRLGFYLLLGAIAAGGGSLIVKSAGADNALVLLRVLAALLVIALGLNLLLDWRNLQFLERGGALLWRRIAPLTRHVLPVSTPARALAAGFVWGALPCGLVYSAVAMAAVSGTVVSGMLVMLLFWLGTLPGLWLAGASAVKLSAWRKQRIARRVGGSVLVAIGIAALAFPLQHLSGTGHAQHSGPSTHEANK